MSFNARNSFCFMVALNQNHSFATLKPGALSWRLVTGSTFASLFSISPVGAVDVVVLRIFIRRCLASHVCHQPIKVISGRNAMTIRREPIDAPRIHIVNSSIQDCYKIVIALLSNFRKLNQLSISGFFEPSNRFNIIPRPPQTIILHTSKSLGQDLQLAEKQCLQA